MSDSKQKSRNKEQILRSNPRCIYCTSPAKTVEHMPPRAMFKDRFRLSGMEFGCCESCNTGTKSADAIASFLAHLAPTDSPQNQWQLPAMKKLGDTADQLVPGFSEEFLNEQNTKRTYRQNEFGFHMPVVEVVANGPIIRRNMTVFSAKLAMALFREHVGKPLSEGSGVYVKWFLNAGLSDKQARGYLSILPIYGELRQGKQRSMEQFGYRYNCDDKSLIVAMVSFHSNLHIFLAATIDMDTYGEAFSNFEELIFVKFGSLLRTLVA